MDETRSFFTDALDAEEGTTSPDETVYQSEAAFGGYLDSLAGLCSGLLRSDEPGKSQRLRRACQPRT